MKTHFTIFESYEVYQTIKQSCGFIVAAPQRGSFIDNNLIKLVESDEI